MPSIKSRQSDRHASLLVAAAEGGQLECLQQLLADLSPDCQTVVCVVSNKLVIDKHRL